LYKPDRQTARQLSLPEKKSVVLTLCWTGYVKVLANKLKSALRA